MPRPRFLPALAVLATACFWLSPLLAPVARAQPVSFNLKNDVPAGTHPSITLTAVERVSDIHLDLTRDDGERYAQKHPGLKPNQKATLNIGDGKAGKAHYQGTLAMTIAGEGPWSYALEFDTLIRAPINVTYDFDHLDLEGRTLKFQQSRPAGKAELVVIGEDGEEIGKGEASYHKEPAGSWLPIGWTQSAARVLMLRLKVTAADGLVSNVELIPWSVAIEHEDVNFSSDSAAIAPGEAGKLDASLRKIEEAARRAERFLKVRLYVAGHTDTVGSKDHNKKLSVDRARAIAEYFRKKGLAISIVYEGFGEDVQKVPTADDTDEPQNRRADYVLGAASSSPPFSGAYRGASSDWKPVK